MAYAATDRRSTVMVVGAGVTGLRLALNLAEIGYRVHLADRAPTIGGLLTQIEHQFPTNHCGLCRLLPRIRRDEARHGCLRRGLIHDRVTFLPRTRLRAVSGLPGDLTVTLESTPPGIRAEACTSCGACLDVCPISVPDPFNAGLSLRKAVYSAAPFSPDSGLVIDWEACTECGECVQVCPTGAIVLQGRPEIRTISAVSLIVSATGRPPAEPDSRGVYGFGVLPNVLTAMGYERLTSPLGPFGGRSPDGLPRRPSDGQIARRVAWVQCVGSRNLSIGSDDCSSNCCMFAVKEAALTRERSGGRAEATIFYMDMRTFGRDFQRYRDRAEHELGVRFIRCRVHSIDPTDDPNEMAVRYVNHEGRITRETFDLVILSTGRSPEAAGLLQESDGLEVSDASGDLGQADIADALTAADALTVRATRRLRQLAIDPPWTSSPPAKPSPSLVDPDSRSGVLALFVSPREEPMDWDWLKHRIPDGIRFEPLVSPLGPPLWAEVRRILMERPAVRLLLLTPGPGTDWPSGRLARETGLPRSFVEVLHWRPIIGRESNPLKRAMVLAPYLRAAAGRLLARRSSEIPGPPVTHTVLVIGGGPAGLSAAKTLAGLDVDVILVEKAEDIGGTAARIHEASLREAAFRLREDVRCHPRVSIRRQTEAVRCQGMAGRFSVDLRSRDGRLESVSCGAVILAPGGAPIPLSESLSVVPDHDRIVTVDDLADRLGNGDLSSAGPLNDVVMILCAGTRREPRNYCSRICCPTALQTGVHIKTLRPQARVTIFYRDVMTYGQSERLYLEARQCGVDFIPYDPASPPAVFMESGRPVVEAFDPLLQESVRITPDWVGLALGVAPNGTRPLARVFGLPTTRDGFLQEADVKWRPTDSPREGVFVCGLGRGPLRLNEALREGEAAAGRALRLLADETLPACPSVAMVNPALCVRCLLCLPVCPFNARMIDPQGGPIQVDPAACQGCGLCVGACPSDAIYLGDFEEQGLAATTRAALWPD